MSQFDSLNSLFGYYGRFQRARGNFGGLPPWARMVLLLTALPAIVLAALSILLILVSILALLLLTVPAYGLLRHLIGGPPAVDTLDRTGTVVVDPGEPGGFGEPGRKRVDSTVIDPPER